MANPQQYSKQTVLPLNEDDEQIREAPVPSAVHNTPALSQQSNISDQTNFALSFLAISYIRGIGPKTLRALIDAFPSLDSVWTADPTVVTATLQQAKVRDSAGITAALLREKDALYEAAYHDLKKFEATGIQLIGRNHKQFPQRLSIIPDAPYWLFIEGNSEVLESSLIGIVGTRKPSKIGIRTTERLTALLCREGFGIVSGLAEGIDASAHRVGLYYQVPQVAVLGTGIDIVFPASTEQVRWRILDSGGAVISEYFPGDSYSKANFVQRNRIQASLALALTPIESQERSGTAHTVNFAEKYHCPLFAVQRGPVAPQNEIVGVLQARGYPLFDIDKAEDTKRLVHWLKSVLPATEWPQKQYNIDTHRFFEDVLRHIEDIIGETPVSDSDLRWLQGQIAQRMQAATQEQDAA